MEISKSFVVNAPADAAWAFLTEPARVVRCLPGATLGDQVDERTYAGTIAIRVGPVQASYRGTMKFERLDRESLTAEIAAQGQETRGRGGARMKMVSRLAAITPTETEISVTSDVQVVGLLAQFGRGMIRDVSDQLFQKFVDCARAELESATAAASPSPDAVPVGAEETETAAEPALATTAAAEAAVAAVSPVVPVAAPLTTLPAAVVPPAAVPPAAEPIDALSLGGAALGRAAGRTVRRPVFWIAVILLLLVLFWVFSR
jgi:uncharacterized protein